jgi:glycosyltransferase involved in cell wall biosynthesis
MSETHPIKICIWMNIPSHYQSAFFHALDCRGDVDLRVVYFQPPSPSRAAEGWTDTHTYQPYESCVEGDSSLTDILAVVADAEERIHIISGHFSSDLVDRFCEEGIRWCHWSEVPGVRLAELLGYRMLLFRLLNPLMLACKRAEGKRIRKHALGAFSQGRLAHRAFRLMGVPEQMISDLYYVPTGLPVAEPCKEMLSFANGRKVFLAVGALCRRKGIGDLLKAFARLGADGWCLVLCGLDRADGQYQALAQELGIADRVLFLGAYPAAHISEVYNAADVFVLASRFDGWGAVLNEAASLGLPLVGTNQCGASWHIVQDGETGYRVRTGNVRSLASALEHYVRNPGLAAKHGQKARALFSDTFTPEANAARVVDALAYWTGR